MPFSSNTIKFDIKEYHLRWIGIPIVGAIVGYVNYYKDPGETWLEFLLISTCYSFVIWNGSYYIMKNYMLRFPHYKQTAKRLLYSFSVGIVYVAIVDNALTYIFYATGVHYGGWHVELLWTCWIKNIPPLVIITLCYEAAFFFNQWKNATLENEKVRYLQLEAELEMLKHQVSPHFLFNSFNTLLYLIHENTDAAAKFTEKLSQIYRYILESNNRSLVTVKQEYGFIKDFIFLLKMRFEENFHVDVHLPSEIMEHQVVPLSLQILVENAIKHNIVNRSQPLYLTIQYDKASEAIVVSNNLQPKRHAEPSTKMGLENINTRYMIYAKRGIDILQTDKRFSVSVPLLPANNFSQASKTYAHESLDH